MSHYCVQRLMSSETIIVAVYCVPLKVQMSKRRDTQKHISSFVEKCRSISKMGFIKRRRLSRQLMLKAPNHSHAIGLLRCYL